MLYTSYSGDSYMPKGHLGGFKVEKIHELNGLPFSETVVIYSFGLVVQLDFDG